MEIVKLLKDYTNTSTKKKFSEYMYYELDSSICVEKIKNKKFMLEYIKPMNDLLIYTTELPSAGLRRAIQ